MTHTLHRIGTRDSLINDYCLLITPCMNKNVEGSLEKLLAIMDDLAEVGVANIGSYEVSNIFDGYTIQDIRNNLYKAKIPRIRCAFSSKEKVFEMLRRIKEHDFGISITITGLEDVLIEECKKMGIVPHSVNFGCGIKGKVEKLPDEEYLVMITQCGHGMISRKLVESEIELVKKGKDPRTAAQDIARPCTCGVANVDRIEKILREKYASKA